jgi:Kdo2-lipid IVA lauroyltransferase/acyltransferase
MRLLFPVLRFMLYGVARLPFGVLYFFSDCFFVLVRFAVRYRYQVITSNLTASFPEKDPSSIKKIRSGFYRHFADLAVEIIKLGRITEAELFEHVTVSGNEILKDLAERKKGVVVVMSHDGNWEWISQRICYEGRRFEYTGVVAKEMSNARFEKLFTDLRMRLQQGFSEIIPFQQTARYLAAVRNKAAMIIAIADQTPHKNQIQYRTRFLNQDTPVFLGPERIARSLGYAVVFCAVTRKKRGYYHVDISLITDSAETTKPYEITDQHVRLLEEDILNQPFTWLWSHRRWKY